MTLKRTNFLYLGCCWWWWIVSTMLLGINGKPTLSFSFHSLAAFATKDVAASPMELKPFSGLRVSNESLRMVYFHEQTVAVAELGPNKRLLNCELVEVYSPEEALQVLRDLSSISKPLFITLQEMLILMDQCQQLEPLMMKRSNQERPGIGGNLSKILPQQQNRGILANNPLTLFSGIIPGTKWCGTGDIAANYHDLGKEAQMDKCCRTHDLCPVKIRAYAERYNLTNNSLYTKSHCKCDDALFNCLKQTDTPTAHIMGNIYFNLVQVPCLEDTDEGRHFRDSRKNF